MTEESLCFRYLRMSPSYLRSERVPIHEGCHVAQPCFYSSPEGTNQTLALERAFRVFMSLAATVGSPTCLEEEDEGGRGIQLVAICNLTARFH